MIFITKTIILFNGIKPSFLSIMAEIFHLATSNWYVTVIPLSPFSDCIATSIPSWGLSIMSTMSIISTFHKDIIILL